MDRYTIRDVIGNEYYVSNLENGEWSYIDAAGSRKELIEKLGDDPEHKYLDIKFQKDDLVVLVETKKKFTKKDEAQLAEYMDIEKSLNPGVHLIGILANTTNDKAKVWKEELSDDGLLSGETTVKSMAYYEKLFVVNKSNDREKVLKNTYALNELLHKMDIKEDLRSQFVGTTLLYVKRLIENAKVDKIDQELVKEFKKMWSMQSASEIITAISTTLDKLLDGSDNKETKVRLLQRNVLEDQKIRSLTLQNWVQILETIILDIYRYIDADSSEGQDILNLFFIAFNKYTGKADKNQAFTPDHITEFMCRITDVDRTKVVLDATCGSGAFLVQAMVKELDDCRRVAKNEADLKTKMNLVKEKHIYGIECEEKAYGLATTNMLIHGDGNSNIKFASCFDCKDAIQSADPDIILLNPPYNAKPIGIPKEYKKTWTKKARDGKEDPTKGLVFIHFLSDVIKELNDKKEELGQKRKFVKLAVLLPVSAAIGTKELIAEEKRSMLEDNTLEAVFTLPAEIFYPGASVTACCMVFTLGKPHVNTDGTVNETFFGYYKEDGFKKKKNLGRVEQFDNNGDSIWKAIENEWISLYRNKKVVDGLSATAVVNGDDEWLCEAYMKTDYTNLQESDFKNTINEYFAHLVRKGEYPILTSSTKIPYELNVENWEEFRVGDLFDISRGSRLVKNEDYFERQTDEFCYPVITAKTTNNGVDGFYNSYNCEGNCLVACGEASGMYTTYQKDACWIMDTARIIVFKDDKTFTKPLAIFFATLFINNMYRFSYGRKAKPSNMNPLIIKLPIQNNEDGTPYIDETHQYSEKGYVPDWQWMEDYIKSLPYGDRLDVCETKDTMSSVENTVCFAAGKGVSTQNNSINKINNEGYQDRKGARDD